MSDLDNKLREIVLMAIGSGAWDSGIKLDGSIFEGARPLTVPEIVDNIKQAFAEDPLIALALKYREAGGRLDDAIIMSRSDWERNLGLNIYMTGSHWYDRFEKLVVIEPARDEDDYLELAKQAAGLTQTKKEDE